MIRTVVSWALYPGLMGGSLLFTLLAIRAGQDPTSIVMVVILLSTIPLLLAQRLLPAEAEWSARPKHFTIDLLHMATSGFALEAVRVLTLGVLIQIALSLHGALGADDLWPTSFPIVFQLGFGILVGDIGAYWVHRACHKFPLLWRIHAVHHSSERMYVFAAARNHPMNAILMHVSHLLPLTLLGAPIEIIALTSVFTGVHGMLQHCNVDLKHGWFNYVFATADLHRWHHSSDFDESNRNFGNNLSIWDWIFGTRYLPAGHPQEVGLGTVHLPENFLAHLATPFLLNRLLIHDEEPLAEAVAHATCPHPPVRE